MVTSLTSDAAAPSLVSCDLSLNEVDVDPFPHVLKPQFIDPSLYWELVRSFPECPPSSGPTGFSLYWGDPQYEELLQEQPSWLALFNTLQSQNFIDWCRRQFAPFWESEGCEIDLSKATYVSYREHRIDKELPAIRVIEHEPHELWVRMDIHQGREGYSRHVHLDHARRLLSMLIYLCDPAENQMKGGDLLLQRIDSEGNHVPVKRITPGHNLMTAFPCSRRSYHSVPEITSTAAPRNYIQVHISSSVDIWDSLEPSQPSRSTSNPTFSLPAAHLEAAPSVEDSRRKLLGSLSGATDITLIRNYGNMGDELIQAGTRSLLANVSYKEVSVLDLEGVGGELAIVSGSGAWCHAHGHMAHYLPRIEEQFDRVVVFPSSFDISQENVYQTLTHSRALFFARERTSYEQIRDLCNAELVHDCALFFDFEPYMRSGSGVLIAYRTDDEAIEQHVPPGNNDISMTCKSLDEFLSTIADHETIETDRAHVMIAGAMLGKRVYWSKSNYHKVPALAEFNLRGLPITQIPSRDSVVREQIREQALEYERQLPDTLFSSPQPLEVTIVMLSHGRLDLTLQAIDSIQQRVRIPFKLLIVDNKSGEAARKKLAEIARIDSRIQLILLEENLGCAGGRNFALGHVATPYVLFVDNDVEVMPGAVEHLLLHMKRKPTAEAVMGRVVFPNGQTHLCGADYETDDGILSFSLLSSGNRFDESIGESGQCRWVSGTFTLMRSEMLERYPLDLTLRHYFEDIEWCYRLNQLGVGEFHRSIEALAIHHHQTKVPSESLPAAARRSQAIRYIETIGAFYSRHDVVLESLCEFVPELKNHEGQLNGPAARLLLDLVNAYGGEWLLERWNRGELAPIFDQRADALREELAASWEKVRVLERALSEEVAASREHVQLEKTLGEELAASRKNVRMLEKALSDVLNSKSFRMTTGLYSRMRAATKRALRQP